MTKPVFNIGLCMAGAVSAGAYTAGVMDYLIEALEQWEYQAGQPGIPNHVVKIPVIGGASAGGMTGILTASAINYRFPPVREMDLEKDTSQNDKNKFWHTWVDQIQDDMFPLLLNTSDIEKAFIPSLLNSKFIEQIAERIIPVETNNWIIRPHFEKELKVFTTLSSLKGFSFDIEFLGSGKDRDQYCVTFHNDYACFSLNTTSYGNNGWIPLDFQSGLNTKLASEAAMATGAFPVGLRSRRLSRNSQHMNDHPFLKSILALNPLLKPKYDSLNVDGGLINNEPFDKVRDYLKSLTGQSNPADYDSYDRFNSTILMIDPFPSEPPVYNDSDQLLNVMGSTLSVLMNQSRIKPEQLVAAAQSDKAGQYLIAPSRQVPQADGTLKDEMGAKAIACGALGGFSGFLSKEFRIHDYFLGRANCEKFLRDHFTVPDTSTNIITAGYAHLSQEEKKRFYSITNTNHLPIIPVLTPRTADKYLPVFSAGHDWPVLKANEIERFRTKTKDRVNDLIMNLADYGVMTKLLLRIGGYVLLNRKLAGVAITTIKDSLKKHQLLKQ